MTEFCLMDSIIMELDGFTLANSKVLLVSTANTKKKKKKIHVIHLAFDLATHHHLSHLSDTLGHTGVQRTKGPMFYFRRDININ